MQNITVVIILNELSYHVFHYDFLTKDFQIIACKKTPMTRIDLQQIFEETIFRMDR